MKEVLPVQIKFIGGAPSKRDFCYVAPDVNIRKGLNRLLELEDRLSQELPYNQREEAIVEHMRLWNKLPEYYKSVLADEAAIIL